jgi:hypothetical protein
MIQPEAGTASLVDHPGRAGGANRSMTSVTLCSENGQPASAVRMGGRLSVNVAFKSAESISPVLGVVIKNSHGIAIFGVNNKFIGGYRFEKRVVSGLISCTLNDLPLMPGRYSLDLYLGDGPQDIDVVYDSISMEILPADVFGTGQLPPPICGPVFWPATFDLNNNELKGEQE